MNYSKAAKHLIIGTASVFLLYVSYTPYNLYFAYPMAVACLAGLWRGNLAPKHLRTVLIEVVVIGMATNWILTRFYEHAVAYTLPLHALGCLLGCSPLIGFALSTWLTRKLNFFVSSLSIALTYSITEFASARLFEITWVATNASLCFAGTPLAQWCSLVTTFGLSFALTGAGVLLCPNLSASGLVRWKPVLCSIIVVLTLWLGGLGIQSQVKVNQLSFSAMMVQPNDVSKISSLESLTSDSLTKNLVDIVLWPEGAASGDWSGLIPADVNATAESPLSKFISEIPSRFHTNCLSGATKCEPGVLELWGEQFPVVCNYNCGYLIGPKTEFDCHEKTALVPMGETIPRWLTFLPEVHRLIYPQGNQLPNFRHGRNFHPLQFRDLNGVDHKIAVAICYESWLPWLPQYHTEEPVEAICHLAFDGNFVHHPELVERMLRSVQLRAIETRKWQLVCSHFRGSAIIDPLGRIVKQLGFEQGVLRTDGH